MKIIVSVLVIFLSAMAIAETSTIVAAGSCATKCDCWVGYEGEQSYFATHESTFICGVNEASPYRAPSTIN